MVEKTNIKIEDKGTKKIKYYFDLDNGYWTKQEYNHRGNEIHFENSLGSWFKVGYNSEGKRIYYETSGGYIKDDR